MPQTEPAPTVIDLGEAIRNRAAKKPIQIYANRRLAGEISAEDYESMERAIKRSPKIYLSLAGNAIYVLWKIASDVIFAAPLFWFWIVVGVAALDQTFFDASMRSMLSDPNAIRPLLLKTVLVAVMGAFVQVVTTMTIQHSSNARFRFINAFHDRLKDSIRQKFNLPPMCELIIDIEHVFDQMPPSNTDKKP